MSKNITQTKQIILYKEEFFMKIDTNTKDLYYMCTGSYYANFDFNICECNVCNSGLCPLALRCDMMLLSQNMILEGGLMI